MTSKQQHRFWLTDYFTVYVLKNGGKSFNLSSSAAKTSGDLQIYSLLC